MDTSSVAKFHKIILKHGSKPNDFNIDFPNPFGGAVKIICIISKKEKSYEDRYGIPATTSFESDLASGFFN